MANPKRRHSRTRRDKRRGSWRIASPTPTACPQCGAPKLSHHICQHCGVYRQRQVLTVKTAEDK